MRLSFSLDNQLGGMLRCFSGSKKGFLVGACQAGKQGQDRVNPGETCLPPYSGEIVLRKISVLLGPLGISGASVGSRASDGMREPRSSTFLWLGCSPRW